MTSGGPGPAAGFTSFLDLLAVHGELEELFLLHQEALVALDVVTAQMRLQKYQQALARHIADEEELLIPVYRRARPVAGGAVVLFLAEHHKMLEMIATFQRDLEHMDEPASGLVRRIIALVDEQATFKRLMEHHDLREHNILYPSLDGVTDEAERRELLTKCLDHRLHPA
ncbi:MAG: hemerythrin domain-containing protein [Armatimonadetes bacterium]|nr:hemerythrin domain-containing protein [Armatimonadota bacterium]MDE2206301.1 hemerythrin domain-containing protein [Armatimonadota bacterium]